MFYDLAKVAVNRLAFSQGHELAAYRRHRGGDHPGWLRSEMMLDNWGVREDNWRDALRPGRADGSHRAPGLRRIRDVRATSAAAVAALAADERRDRWNQQSVTSAQLAREYGFTDIDGRNPTVWN